MTRALALNIILAKASPDYESWVDAEAQTDEMW
jgi:hypothetical protein